MSNKSCSWFNSPELLKTGFLFFLFISILSSCVVTRDEGNHRKDQPQDHVEMAQVSVVDTVFDGSFIFRPFVERREEGPLIPGLADTAVPQGMAYWSEQDLMIISNYRSDKKAGVLTLIRMEDGHFIKWLSLLNQDGTEHRGHLGGLAVSRDYLWISSEKGVYNLPLEDLASSESGTALTLTEQILTETKGSFASYTMGILWVGEFTRKDGSYPAAEHHQRINRTGKSHRAWLGGYRLNSETDTPGKNYSDEGLLLPDYLLSIPDEVQGAALYDGMVYLSASFGRKNDSRLITFKSPVDEVPHQSVELVPGMVIPLWFLDEINKVNELTLPPMSEGIVVYDNSLAVLFESAAAKYRNSARLPLDRLQIISAEE